MLEAVPAHPVLEADSVISAFHVLEQQLSQQLRRRHKPQAESYLNVNEETVRRTIRSKRLRALRRGKQWFIPRDVLVVFANSYDPKTGQIRQML